MLALQNQAFGTDNREGEILVERRDCRRAAKQGSIALALKESELAGAALQEYTTQGARVVLNGAARVNQRVDFLLTTNTGRLDGYARVAWTAPLANGKHVAGLEFIDFTMRTARTDRS